MTHGDVIRSLGGKMGLRKDGLRLACVQAPDNYPALLHDVLPHLHWQAVDEAAALAKQAYDVVHLFAVDRQALRKGLPDALQALAPGGALWISWPKKTSAAFYDLDDNTVRAAVLPTGWVDIKVIAVDATWSGLKFLRRRCR